MIKAAHVHAFLTIASAAIALPSSAQSPATLPLPDGGTVEIVGLRHWTPQMIQDSLARYSPGVTLQSHACAAALRYKLGFADASAIRYHRPGEPLRVIVSVREPQDSALVRYRQMPLDTSSSRADWRVVTALYSMRPAAFWNVVQLHTAQPGQLGLELGSGEDSVAAVAALAFLKARTTERDFNDARDVIERSPNLRDRAVAALILGNFPNRDETYLSLLDAMRETDGQVKVVASQVLEAAARRATRVIDWSQAADGIRSMLSGTSLPVLPSLIRTLNSAGVGPSNASSFLKGGADMLLAYAASGTPLISAPSRALLAKLRGADLGDSLDAWRSWIQTL